MYNCIYSKRYPTEKIESHINIPNAKFSIKAEQKISDQEYIKNAIALADLCRIGLDIYENEKEYRLVFFLRSALVNEKGSSLWETLFCESYMFGTVTVDDFARTIMANFFRKKTP